MTNDRDWIEQMNLNHTLTAALCAVACVSENDTVNIGGQDVKIDVTKESGLILTDGGQLVPAFWYAQSPRALSSIRWLAHSGLCLVVRPKSFLKEIRELVKDSFRIPADEVTVLVTENAHVVVCYGGSVTDTSFCVCERELLEEKYGKKACMPAYSLNTISDVLALEKTKEWTNCFIAIADQDDPGDYAVASTLSSLWEVTISCIDEDLSALHALLNGPQDKIEAKLLAAMRSLDDYLPSKLSVILSNMPD